MKPLRRVSQAFGRTSSVICAVILLSFAVELASTTYHSLTYEKSSFENSAEVQDYKNRIENQISVMSEWDLTKYYWKHNLGVAGYRALFTPWYLGVSSEVYQSYFGGIVNTYMYHENTLVPFRAAIETHGLLEMTGFFIISAITARLAWNLWKGLAHLMTASTKKRKLKLKKSKARIKEIFGDFLILASIGILMIFLAAPIEAYISPSVLATFRSAPLLPYVYLAAVVLLYLAIFFVQFRGWMMMKKDAKKIQTDIKFLLKGKFVPAHLSLLMFILFTIPAIIVILM